MKTRVLPVKYAGLVVDKFPSSGPFPNVRAMKARFYGKDSICVRCGAFVYFLGNRFTPEVTLIYSLAK